MQENRGFGFSSVRHSDFEHPKSTRAQPCTKVAGTITVVGTSNRVRLCISAILILAFFFVPTITIVAQEETPLQASESSAQDLSQKRLLEIYAPIRDTSIRSAAYAAESFVDGEILVGFYDKQSSDLQSLLVASTEVSGAPTSGAYAALVQNIAQLEPLDLRGA